MLPQPPPPQTTLLHTLPLGLPHLPVQRLNLMSSPIITTPPPPTRVVKLKRNRHGILQDCDIYIGRRCYMGGWKLEASEMWQNPYTRNNVGSVKEAIRRYEADLVADPIRMSALSQLRGKVLGCWCKTSPSVPCHGDVLVKWIHQLPP